MIKEANLLNIMYSCNDNYAMQAGVSIISLLENNKDFQQINIFFIEDNLSADSIKKLKNIVDNYNRNIYFYKFNEVCKIDFPSDRISRHPFTIYAKLFLSFLTEIDKIIYLDCDIIINSSLNELWSSDVSKDLIAGVAMPYSEDIKNKVKMGQNDLYICDGIVLINLNNWRKNNIEDSCIEFIKRNKYNPPMLSEGTINYVCRGKIKILHPKYNLMPFMLLLNSQKIKKLFSLRNYYTTKEINEARNSPVLIHYLNELYNRPWNKKSDHPYKNKFLEYYMMSPWRNDDLFNYDISFKTKITKFCLKKLPFRFVLFTRKSVCFILKIKKNLTNHYKA